MLIRCRAYRLRSASSRDVIGLFLSVAASKYRGGLPCGGEDLLPLNENSVILRPFHCIATDQVLCWIDSFPPFWQQDSVLTVSERFTEISRPIAEDRWHHVIIFVSWRFFAHLCADTQPIGVGPRLPTKS
jgi:hypothetical protein